MKKLFWKKSDALNAVKQINGTPYLSTGDCDKTFPEWDAETNRRGAMGEVQCYRFKETDDVIGWFSDAPELRIVSTTNGKRSTCDVCEDIADAHESLDRIAKDTLLGESDIRYAYYNDERVVTEIKMFVEDDTFEFEERCVNIRHLLDKYQGEGIYVSENMEAEYLFGANDFSHDGTLYRIESYE